MDNQIKDKKNTLSNQKRIAVILAALAVVLAVVYVIILLLKKDYSVVLPLYDADGDVLDYTYTCESGNPVTEVSRDESNLTLEADSEISYTARPFIYPELNLEKLDSIHVVNDSGEFTVYLDKTSGEYLFKGNEMILYNEQPLAELKFQSRYMLAIKKVDGSYTDNAALADFGLDEESNPVSVTVTDTDGNSYTVLFGDKLVTGAAYYAKAADKPYVYVVDSTVSVFFNEENSYFNPMITTPLSQSEYNYIDSFSISKNGEMFMSSEIVPEEQRQGTGDTDLHKLNYPAKYPASLTKYYEALACFANLSGSSVVETNVLSTSEENANELFEKYGLTVASNDVKYSYIGTEYRFITGHKYTDEDGTTGYYAYSPYMDTIVKLPLENASFLEYELIDFIDQSVFQMNIDNVSEITAHVPGVTCHFVLEGTGKDLKVTETNTGNVIDTDSFRQFFISLLTVKIEGYATKDDVTGPNEFGFTVVSRFDETSEFEFDIISTTRALITLDGNSEFYTNRSYVTTAAERLLMLVNGEKIEADY